MPLTWRSRLQTPVIVMTDLDLGMNDHVSQPFEWDDSRSISEAKYLNAEELDKMERFGRYLDTDNDGLPYRTYPATHHQRLFLYPRHFPRRICAYTEDGAAYKRNMDRLLRKWNTAKNLVPAPHIYDRGKPSHGRHSFLGTSIYRGGRSPGSACRKGPVDGCHAHQSLSVREGCGRLS